MKNSEKKIPLIPRGMWVVFALTTSLFALWGFANDITNPLVKAFEDIFLINAKQSSLVQTAFYGGYATMAIPAAIFIRRYTYKSGILVGLALYAAGGLLFIPASVMMEFGMFLAAFYVMTFGLAFLETTANPYILSMGDPATATRRLNMAQAFNPLGCITGMLISKFYILSLLDTESFKAAALSADADRAALSSVEAARAGRVALENFASESPAEFLAMQAHDLSVVRFPYVVLSLVVIAVFLIFLLKKMPQTKADAHHDLRLWQTFMRLAKNGPYVMGVFAQTFYVGAQIMCWTYIIHYGMDLGLTASEAQTYNICAMFIFCTSRFVCTWFLKYFNSGALLAAFAVLGGLLTLGSIFISGFAGLYCLVGVSACMSLMFPTIYGIALDGLGEDAKLASAGLIFAIVGGALMPPLQGGIIDLGQVGSLTGVRASFLLPFVCFVFIAIYGALTYKFWTKRKTSC